jgi:HNH endonuclease
MTHSDPIYWDEHVLERIQRRIRYGDLPDPATGVATPCWLTTWRPGDLGYITIGVTPPDEPKRFYKLHRLMWAVFNGVQPDATLDINHLCRNKACCNPWHLELVPHRRNTQHRNEHITHCPNGHLYSLDKRGRKVCTPCRNANTRAWYAEHPEARQRHSQKYDAAHREEKRQYMRDRQQRRVNHDNRLDGSELSH